jgi:hypothetical protein
VYSMPASSKGRAINRTWQASSTANDVSQMCLPSVRLPLSSASTGAEGPFIFLLNSCRSSHVQGVDHQCPVRIRISSHLPVQQKDERAFSSSRRRSDRVSRPLVLRTLNSEALNHSTSFPGAQPGALFTGLSAHLDCDPLDEPVQFARPPIASEMQRADPSALPRDL